MTIHVYMHAFASRLIDVVAFLDSALSSISSGKHHQSVLALNDTFSDDVLCNRRWVCPVLTAAGAPPSPS